MEKKVPIRTCIVCRSAKPKKELMRIVKGEDGISFDKTGKQNGRGAYICNDKACLDKLIKTKGLNKVFKENVDESVYKKLAEELLGTEE